MDRRFQLNRTSAGFDIEQVQSARPVPAAHQVLIKVHAVSLNRRDIMIRELAYPVFGADHFTPLSDAAGEVVAVGAGVTRAAVGDRVCSTFFQQWPDGRVSLPAVLSALGSGGPGVFADYVVLDEGGIAPLPAEWSYEEGACISCAALTAWSGFAAAGGLRQDDWVLVIGTGGVAVFAVQIAVAHGAKVALVSSSNHKLKRVRTLGAAFTVNYEERPDWDVAVREATGGVQHAIELGGQGTLHKSLACMAVGGHVALIGALAGFGGDLSGGMLISSALRVSAIVVGSHADHVAMTEFLVAYGIRPVIDRVFDLDSVPQAYAHLSAGAFGKVVIRL